MSTPGSGSSPGMWQPPALTEMQAWLPQYQFLELIGRGGMGVVYKAVQVSLDRPVAVKVLPAALLGSEDSSYPERFKNEARMMARMNHPAIVNVYDFGETPSGLLYFVMEFIDGTDVAQMIAAQGRLPEPYALSITAHVCAALHYAHTHGVIHRDIKPANILINVEGAVKVADFGLAKQDDATQSGLTQTHMAMGTPDFVAPEALIPGIPLDGRADLYAVGVMLYQMLTGEIPRGIWTMPGLKLGTDPRFDAIIAKAMQTDREARYQSAAELRRDLDSILTTPRARWQKQQAARAATTPPATEPPAAEPAAPAKAPNLGLWLGLGSAAVLAVAVYFLFTPGPPPHPKPASPATTASTRVAPAAPTPPASAVAEAPAALPAIKPEAAQAAAAAPEPKPPVLATHDLLALATAPTGWAREGPVLTHTGVGKPAVLTSALQVASEDYSLELHARRLPGGAALHLQLPVAPDRHLTLVLNAPGQPLLAAAASSTWQALEDALHLGVRVTRHKDGSNRVQVHRLDPTGPPLLDWSGSLHESPPADPAGLVLRAPEGGCAIELWQLRLHQGSARPLPQATPPPAAPAPAAMATAAPPPPAPTASPEPADPRLAQLAAGFQARYDHEAGNPHRAAVAALDQSYIANGLARARATAQQRGLLDEVTRLEEEKQRVQDGVPLPPADLDSLPESLRQLRATYRTARARIDAEHARKAAPLYDLYLGALDAYIVELTKADQITQAQQVKTQREAIARRRAVLTGTEVPVATAAAAEAPTAPPANIPVAPEALAPVPKAAFTRELIEWLQKRTNFRIGYLDGGTRRQVNRDSLAELPKSPDLWLIDTGNEGGEPFNPAWLEGQTDLEQLHLWQLQELPSPAVLRGMKKLSLLRLTGQLAKLDDAVMRLFPPLPALRQLDIQGAFGQLGLQILCERCPELERLALNTCQFEAGGLAALKRLKTLRHLTCDGVRAPVAEFTVLTTLPKLESLVIANQPLTGLRLAGSPSLAHLDLSNARLSDAEAASLTGFSRLTQLRLAGNSLTDATLPALRGLTRLETLDLGGNPITGATLGELAALKNLADLRLAGAQLRSEALRQLPPLPALRRAMFDNNAGFDDAAAAALASSKNLDGLNLSVTGIGDIGLQALCNELRALTHLNLAATRVTDAGLPALRRLGVLDSLVLDQTALTDAAVEPLKKLVTLRSLSVRDTRLTPAGLEALRKALPQCAIQAD